MFGNLRSAFVVAAAVVIFAGAAYAQSTLISDGFETSYDGWTNSGDGIPTLTAVRGEGYNSGRAMKVSGRTSPEHAAASLKGFYLEGGETYNYSVFVKHAGKSAETFNLTITWELPGGALGKGTVATGSVKPNSWMKLAGSYATPAGSIKPTLFIATNSVADFYFDDFVVTGKSAPVLAKSAAAWDNVGLRDIYARHFRVGNILNGTTANNQGIRTVVGKEYNSISMENEHKPDATMTRTNSTNTDIKAQINTGAAAAMNFCAQNNIPMRGHVLTWHGQTPDWFFIQNINDANWNQYRNGSKNSIPWTTKANMKVRLESYIKNLFALYKDQYPNVYFYAYDVTNEAFDGAGKMRPAGFDHNGAGGQTPSNAGDSPWQGVYGNDNVEWIEDAFTYARRYAPSYTKLFYNDFNEWQGGKKEGIRDRVLVPLKNKGILDGMGMQSHVSANRTDGWSGESAHLPAMDFYANLGIEVQLTELDPSTNGGQYASQQPTRYANIFRKALEINKKNVGKITAICIWAPNDANTWLGSNNTPALHDAGNNRKPAYDSIAAIVPQSEWGDGKNPTFGGGGTTPTITVGCNVNNLSETYLSGASVPRPNVTCSNGTPGTASFRVSGSEDVVAGWAAANGTHAFWNPGVRTVTLNSLTCGTTVVTPSPAVTCGSFTVEAPVEPDANGYFFYHTYEDNTVQNWEPRFGGATVANTAAQKANGSRSLSVTGRTADYVGPTFSLNTKTFVPGKDYSFSVLAMYNDASAPATVSFKLTLQYNLEGETIYDQIALVDAKKGAWTVLENKNFTIPEGATNLVLYAETPGNTVDFFIDDAMGGAAGTEAPGKEGVTSLNNAGSMRNSALPLVALKAKTLVVNVAPDAKARVRVVNLSGKTVAKFNASGSTRYSLTKVPAGRYFVEVRENGVRKTTPVMVR